MDLRIGDLVDIIDNTDSFYVVEHINPRIKGQIGYIVVGFNRKDAPFRRVLVEGVYSGHSGPRHMGVLTDHTGELIEFHSKGDMYWWVNTRNVSKIDSIKLTNPQIKRIIS